MMSTRVANSDGCSWKGPEGEPALRTLPGRRGQHQDQRQQDPHVEHGADLLEAAIVEQGQGHHHHQADDQKDGLALQEVVRILTGQGQFPLGGGVDDHHADESEQRGAAHQDHVESGAQDPGPGGDVGGGVVHQGTPAREVTRTPARPCREATGRPPPATWPRRAGRAPSTPPPGGGLVDQHPQAVGHRSPAGPGRGQPGRHHRVVHQIDHDLSAVEQDRVHGPRGAGLAHHAQWGGVDHQIAVGGVLGPAGPARRPRPVPPPPGPGPTTG